MQYFKTYGYADPLLATYKAPPKFEALQSINVEFTRLTKAPVVKEFDCIDISRKHIKKQISHTDIKMPPPP